MGQVQIYVIGIWRYGFKDPVWILIILDKIMNKTQVYLDKMIAMLMLAYVISVVIGEAIRDVQYA
jgi:hypothetical protein